MCASLFQFFLQGELHGFLKKKNPPGLITFSSFGFPPLFSGHILAFSDCFYHLSNGGLACFLPVGQNSHIHTEEVT